MTTRDRTVVMVLGLLAMVAAFWFLLLSPKRAEVATLKDGVASAQLRLQAANAAAATAAPAKASYGADYRAVADLGKAVPADDGVPSLVFQLQTASKASRIAFDSIKLTGAAAPAPAPAAAAPPVAQAGALVPPQGVSAGAATPPTGTPSAASTTTPAATPAPGTPAPATTTPPAGAAVPAAQSAFAGLPPGASVGPAGLPTMPFDFEFSGPFTGLESLLRRIAAFTKTSDGRIKVDGRLMTIDSIALSGFPTMQATIHATAFLLPAEQGLLAGADAAGPATGATAATTTTVTTTTAGAGAPVPITPVATAAPAAGVGR